MDKLTFRQFLKVSAATLASSSLAILRFSPNSAVAEVRQYRLGRITEIRNTSTYCSVGCGVLMYAFGDGAKNAKASIIHVGGDPDSDKWVPISWNDAFDRIAMCLKTDRDANLTQNTAEGKAVNRWVTTGFLAVSATSNEAGHLPHKVVRSLGMLAFDNQARV